MEYRSQTGAKVKQLDEVIFVGFFRLLVWWGDPFPKHGREPAMVWDFFFFPQLHRDQKYVAIF